MDNDRDNLLKTSDGKPPEPCSSYASGYCEDSVEICDMCYGDFISLMRSATNEESKTVTNYIDSISNSTGMNIWENDIVHDLRRKPYDLPKIDIDNDDDKILYVEDDSYNNGYRCEIGYFRGLEGNNGDSMWDNCQHGWIQGRVIAWRNVPRLSN